MYEIRCTQNFDRETRTQVKTYDFKKIDYEMVELGVSDDGPLGNITIYVLDFYVPHS
jgi:hypothetical protein